MRHFRHPGLFVFAFALFSPAPGAESKTTLWYGRPANYWEEALPGLRNDSFLPSWFGRHTSDINVEMNCWPAETTNLAECRTALFDLIDSFVPAARVTARLSYGVPGLVPHSMTNYTPKAISGDTHVVVVPVVAGGRHVVTPE